MIDESHEELAALYALDLLEGTELAQFETTLARDPALRTLVRELREASSALAHTAPTAPPPAELRARVLASVDTAAPAADAPDNVIRPFFGLSTILPWAAAACFAALALVLGQRYRASQSELALVRTQQEVVDVALQTARNELEAERLLNSRAVTDLNREIGENTQRLAQAEQSLADARNQIASLNLELKSQSDLAELKITALASLLNNSPEALAVAVWDPAKQEGVLKVEKLPALAANEDYQLWVVDPQYQNPVDGGVFTVDPQTGEARLQFKPKQPVQAVNAFAVTRERKGGVPKAEGPFVLLGK